MSFFVLETFTFLYYANEESDDVIDRSTKTVQHSIKNISGNIKAVYITKKNENCHAVASYAAGPVLITTKIPRFYLTQGSSTPNNQWGELR